MSASDRQPADATRVIERLDPRAAEELVAAVLRSTRLHHPWAEPPSDVETMREYLGAPEHVRTPFGVRAPDGGIAGVINVSQIIRGGFCNAFLGFYAFTPYDGRRLMSRGLREVIDVCFGELALHRLEANVQPANERSARLVRAVGLRHEGFSPRYLWVCGDWRDHDRYAITAEEWPAIRERHESR